MGKRLRYYLNLIHPHLLGLRTLRYGLSMSSVASVCLSGAGCCKMIPVPPKREYARLSFMGYLCKFSVCLYSNVPPSVPRCIACILRAMLADHLHSLIGVGFYKDNLNTKWWAIEQKSWTHVHWRENRLNLESLIFPCYYCRLVAT